MRALLMAAAQQQRRGVGDNILRDLDGNEYTTVIIGEQEWIVENWRCTKYADGSDILHFSLNDDWIAATEGAYCVYNNDVANIPAYGLLYNQIAIRSEKGFSYIEKGGVDQNFQVTTIADIITLANYLGGVAVAGGKLKEIGTTHWNSPNTGATDEVGFSGMGGGYRLYNTGVFSSVKSRGRWWTSSPNSPPRYDFMRLDSSNDDLLIARENERFGFSIRLMRNI